MPTENSDFVLKRIASQDPKWIKAQQEEQYQSQGVGSLHKTKATQKQKQELIGRLYKCSQPVKRSEFTRKPSGARLQEHGWRVPGIAGTKDAPPSFGSWAPSPAKTLSSRMQLSALTDRLYGSEILSRDPGWIVGEQNRHLAAFYTGQPDLEAVRNTTRFGVLSGGPPTPAGVSSLLHAARTGSGYSPSRSSGLSPPSARLHYTTPPAEPLDQSPAGRANGGVADDSVQPEEQETTVAENDEEALLAYEPDDGVVKPEDDAQVEEPATPGNDAQQDRTAESTQDEVALDRTTNELGLRPNSDVGTPKENNRASNAQPENDGTAGPSKAEPAKEEVEDETMTEEVGLRPNSDAGTPKVTQQPREFEEPEIKPADDASESNEATVAIEPTPPTRNLLEESSAANKKLPSLIPTRSSISSASSAVHKNGTTPSPSLAYEEVKSFQSPACYKQSGFTKSSASLAFSEVRSHETAKGSKRGHPRRRVKLHKTCSSTSSSSGRSNSASSNGSSSIVPILHHVSGLSNTQSMKERVPV
ncbi:hypothetical protein DIPPA_20767 [Diplonema papillatum]|nr:hypothetical protein DIPPA_20767 [Diplonema papillatum]